jgi:DnaK suppressor protein
MKKSLSSQAASTAIVAPRAAKSGLSEAELRAMSADDYMNAAQLEFFRQRLLEMRTEILARESVTKERLHQNESHADPADRASAEEEHFLDLRLREREMTLLRKIEESLRRIANKDYGYCTKTGEPIGISRLLARPTATVCIDIKDRDERFVAHYGESRR